MRRPFVVSMVSLTGPGSSCQSCRDDTEPHATPADVPDWLRTQSVCVCVGEGGRGSGIRV